MEKVKFYPVKGYIDFKKNATSNIESFWEKEAKKTTVLSRLQKGLLVVCSMHLTCE